MPQEDEGKFGKGFRDYGAGAGAGAAAGALAGEAVFQRGKKYAHSSPNSPFIYRDSRKEVPATKFEPPVNPNTGKPYGSKTKTYTEAEKKAKGRPGVKGLGLGTADERGKYRDRKAKHSDEQHAKKLANMKKRINKRHRKALGYGSLAGIGLGGISAAAYREMQKRKQRRAQD